MSTAQSTRRNSSESSALSTTDKRPAEDIIQYLREYAREKPDVAALWCFGIGFVLGWKLKPW